MGHNSPDLEPPEDNILQIPRKTDDLLAFVSSHLDTLCPPVDHESLYTGEQVKSQLCILRTLANSCDF
jgi:hypothetical protein